MPKYEEELRNKLAKTRAPVTVGQYIKRLQVLNDGKPITSMKFLTDFDAILTKLENLKLAFTTKTSYLAAICATLGLYSKYHKLYKRYQEKMIQNANEIKGDLAKNERNDKQKESILPKEEVVRVREELKKAFDESPLLTTKVWELLLAHLCICLYSLISPRRNRDYSEMWVVLEEPAELDKTKNYYVASEHLFIFNNYKTKEVYGEQRFPVPAPLVEVLEEYLNFYVRVLDVSNATEFPLLVHFNGTRVHPINGITRILNKAFDRKVGSTALRHIFVSDEFSAVLEKQKRVAFEMSHSVQTQKDYTKIV